MLNPNDLEIFVGQTVVGLCHPPDREDIGMTSIDLVIAQGSFYRFATEEIGGMRTTDGCANEHFSLVLQRVDAPNPQDEQTHLTGSVIKADVIRCDEWLGPVDKNIASVGTNPRVLFNGRVGSGPAGATSRTVVRGALLQTKDWQLPVRTHSFPGNLDFTTDRVVINEFLTQYAVDLRFDSRGEL